MRNAIRKTAVAAAALGALGLGGAAISGAADDTKPSATSGSGSPVSPARPGRPQREALAAGVAAKVKAAALERVPGATVVRTEAGGPYDSAYHAHITTSGGTPKVVLVDASFEATAVQAERARGGRGRSGPDHHGGGGETALTGATKTKVEAAVLAEYAGATIERTETNRDAAAPYESHITTSDGKELEVLVSGSFEVVDAREHPARP